MITRTSLADEVDELDKSIKALNDSKGEAFTNYREQMFKAGVAKENIKKEIDAVKAAIKRRRAASKDENGLLENEALADEIFNEITRKVRASRAHVEIIEKFSTDGTKYDATSGEILEDINPRLAKQVVDGMQTETGRAALIAAVDIMIEREEAEEFQAKASGDNGAPVQAEKLPADSVTGDASRSSRGDDSPATNFGTIELMHQQIAAVRASEIASASQGEAEAPSAERVSPQAETDTGSAAANTGGDHVDDHQSAATSAGALVSKAPATRLLRPHCQRPEMCGSGTRDHCWNCKKAIREGETA